MPSALKEGEKAPAFALESTVGPIRLKDFAGAPLVLYFYPRDDTPGCTTEALDFTAHAKAFEKLGAKIVGVSKDSVESHQKFEKKHKLKVILASDPDGAACEAYGVWGEKSLYGRVSMGIIRSTFLIGPKGKLVQVWPKVSVKGHVEAVLEAVKSM